MKTERQSVLVRIIPREEMSDGSPQNIVDHAVWDGFDVEIIDATLETALAAKESEITSMRSELTRIFGTVKPHHGMTSFGSMLARIGTTLSPPTEPKECQWLNDPSDDFNYVWQTDCGHEFVFNEGTPSYNGAKFCCYCGKKLVERKEAP